MKRHEPEQLNARSCDRGQHVTAHRRVVASELSSSVYDAARRVRHAQRSRLAQESERSVRAVGIADEGLLPLRFVHVRAEDGDREVADAA